MRRKPPQLRDERPELKPLTDDELSAYVAAAYRRIGPGSGHWVMRLVMGLLFLGVILALLIPTAWIWGSALVWLYDKYGTVWVIAAVSLFAVVVLSVLRVFFGTDRVEILRRTGFLHELARAGVCARCRYGLAGLSDQERPGVARCPECGLVNPVARTSEATSNATSLTKTTDEPDSDWVAAAMTGLTQDELDRYVETVRQRHAGQRAVDSAESLWTGVFVITAATVAFALTWWWLEPASNVRTTPSLGRIIVWYTLPAAAAMVVLLIGAQLDRQRRIHAARRRRAEALRAAFLADKPRCAGCRYDLTGVGPAEGRTAVARCPECGLVNPVARERADTALGGRD